MTNKKKNRGFKVQPNSNKEQRLTRVLDSIKKVIEATKALEQNSLPEKVWYKQQFAIGVNEVTRALERMSPATETEVPSLKPDGMGINRRPSLSRLQAILIAHDSPHWLTRHLPDLASSRKVPVLLVRLKRKGSMRLGELVKLKTAIAIGVKDKGSAINQIIKEVFEKCNGKKPPKGEESTEAGGNCIFYEGMDFMLRLHR